MNRILSFKMIAFLKVGFLTHDGVWGLFLFTVLKIKRKDRFEI